MSYLAKGPIHRMGIDSQANGASRRRSGRSHISVLTEAAVSA